MPREPSIEDLFSRAVGIADAEKRAGYLREACGQSGEVREQIEALLNSHPDSVAESPLFQFRSLSASDEIGEKSGDQIGPYLLGDRLGEGGFGVVFAAEQKAPVRRRVAIKILKPGMDARQIILRFEQEQQTLALMDHPHIARVLDAGATRSGRPFFVMELVQGQPITEFCDDQKLEVAHRLRLFLKVCRAIHHAHQKGIIHRDLKPPNILVDFAQSEENETRPKIIDFGIAKALRGKLTNETVQTVGRQFLGTPAYMSPEQAFSGEQNVDTRSDIYSLGALLFELLVGSPPRAAMPVNEPARWGELIREFSVIKPSAHLARLSTGAVARIADNRKTKPGELARAINGDLDWIVVKAIDHDPNQRYESAEALARDIERFLENRPVEARPRSPIYLANRFVRRHRLLVSIATIAVAAVFAGGGAAAWGWRVARHETRIARAESQKAQQLNDILFLGLLRSDPGQGKGKEYTVRQLLDDLGRDVDGGRSMTPDVECALRDMLSFIYRETGDYEQALHHGRRGLALARQQPGDPRRLTSFLMTLGEISKELDDFAAATDYLDECLSIRTRLFGKDHPEVIRTVLTAARVHYKRGNRAVGLSMVSDALVRARLETGRPWGTSQLIRCLNMNEMLLRDEGRFAEAAALNRERLELVREQQGEGHAETLLAQTHLGGVLIQLNRSEEALEILTVALQRARRHLGNDYPLTLETMVALADCHAQLGNNEPAANLYDEAIAQAGSSFSVEFPDRREWILRAMRFHEKHGRVARSQELKALLKPQPEEL